MRSVPFHRLHVLLCAMPAPVNDDLDRLRSAAGKYRQRAPLPLAMTADTTSQPIALALVEPPASAGKPRDPPVPLVPHPVPDHLAEAVPSGGAERHAP
jgi:hypothetical protein